MAEVEPISGARRSRPGLIGALARAGGRVLDTLYPPVCLVCDRPVSAPDTLCPACFAKLAPITAPFCPRLGLPFAADPGPGVLCAEALADPPPFGRARSAVLYDETARAVIARLKYADRPEAARFCARPMAEAGREFWDDAPVLVPVPLHPLRHLLRRYNQSAELARHLARRTGLAVDPRLLARVRSTRRQVGLSAEGRARNVAGAFAADPARIARLEGRPVVLIDDVYTTGATVKAATRALLRAGAARVDVLTFARVVSAGALPI